MTRALVRSAALAAALAVAPSGGCAFAVDHPAITAGVLGGVIGFGTCKLASDNLGSCLAVGGGAGAFLGLVAATALWLGGPGNTAPVEEQAQPLPEDGRPIRHRRRPAPVDAPTDGAPATNASPAAVPATRASPAAADAPPGSPVEVAPAGTPAAAARPW